MRQYLPIVELFYSIQGEGANTGKAAFFIRLAGCKVRCSWCDSKNSWDEESFEKIEISDIVSQALSYPSRVAIITGGEPLSHNLERLSLQLREQGFYVCIETSGTEPISGTFDWITVSPKKRTQTRQELLNMASELKIVIEDEEDLKLVEQYRAKVSPITLLYLQPEWRSSKKILRSIIEYIKANPHWRISLQTHKYLKIP